MRQAVTQLDIPTRGQGLYEFTGRVRDWLGEATGRDGLLTLFVRHTSASLLIQENADAAVLRDLDAFFRRLVPDGDPLFTHVAEGADDMPAHVKAALTQTHLAVPVAAGIPLLGTWQGIYLFEHRHAPHSRTVAVHLLTE